MKSKGNLADKKKTESTTNEKSTDCEELHRPQQATEPEKEKQGELVCGFTRDCSLNN